MVLGPEWIPGLLDAEGAAVRAELGVSWLDKIYDDLPIEFLY